MSDAPIVGPGKARGTAPQPPLLVLVNGAPASGKSTLAGWLAHELALPLVAKDAIKEILMDTLGVPDRQRSRELSGASYELVYAMISWLLDGGVGVIVDCNFSRGHAEESLLPLVIRTRTVLLHCETASQEIAMRYADRVARRVRHPGHFDSAALPDLLARIAAQDYEPLQLDVPTLRVDTTDGYRPDYEAIREFILSRRAML